MEQATGFTLQYFLFQYSERFISSLLLVEINDIKDN